MSPFDVLVRDVSDVALAPLLTEIARAGFASPIVMQSGVPAPAAATPVPGTAEPELPQDWRVIDEREGVSYTWPEETDTYDTYRVYAADTGDGTIRVAVGWTFSQRWGGERRRAVAFLTSGAPQQPLAEFVATDDFDETHELLSVIRGRGGTSQMFGPTDPLPEIYRRYFDTAIYADRIQYRGAYNKQAVVVSEHGVASLLNHGLIQGRRREATRTKTRGATIKGITNSEFDGVTVPTLRHWESYWLDPNRHTGNPAITAERPVTTHLEMIRAELRARGR